MGNTITLDDLTELEFKIKALAGPTITKFWIIDQPELASEIRDRLVVLQGGNQHMTSIVGYTGTFHGIPIEIVDSHALKLNDRLRLPMLAQLPGAWAVMSDGTVRMYVETGQWEKPKELRLYW